MSLPRRICAVTGTRADYDLLLPSLRAIEQEPTLELQLAVTGAHLDPQAGSLARVRDDGFRVDAEIDMLLTDDSPNAITKSLARGVTGFADALDRLRPDLLLLLGDRYEILAAAQAAMLARIPIAHIHGGESTEGVIDEAIRHAVTKMSHIHFVAAPSYRRRVIQLGEDPQHVHVVGAAALDNLANMEFLQRQELEAQLGYAVGEQHLLLTYHPVTLEGQSPEQALAPLLGALDALPDATVTITGANADPLGRRFNEHLQAYAARHEQVHFVYNLGQRRYLSLARLSQAVVGNSSSGLIEIPVLGVPTVNIGDRQRNRLQAPSVINCKNDREAILDALERAASPPFREMAAHRESPYGTPGAAQRILDVLQTASLDGILKKHFYDLPEGHHENPVGQQQRAQATPYPAIGANRKPPMKQRILAISPHPDDETLGCGGTLLKARDAGAETAWLIITSMREDDGFSRQQVEVREALTEQVAGAYGFSLVERAGLPAARLDTLPRQQIVQAISSMVERFQPHTLILPYPGDAHTDHRIVFEAAQAASKWFRHPSVQRVLCYETLSETGFGLDPADNGFRPNCYEDIGSQLRGKLDILSLYDGELGDFPFPRSLDAVTAQARLRGSESGFEAAEAFMLLRERRD